MFDEKALLEAVRAACCYQPGALVLVRAPAGADRETIHGMARVLGAVRQTTQCEFLVVHPGWEVTQLGVVAPAAAIATFLQSLPEHVARCAGATADALRSRFLLVEPSGDAGLRAPS